MVAGIMLKTRKKRVASSGKAAVERLASIKTSLTNLGDEDLLDLADIFQAEPRTVLGEMAFAEMTRRNISL